MTAKREPPSSAWKPGISGNPRGKPAGARNKATVMVLTMMEHGAEEITGAIITAAKSGDLMAARMVIDRLAPPMRERPVTLDLPATNSAAGIGLAQDAILQAVAAGDITPGEGAALTNMLATRLKTIEATELVARLEILEQRTAKNEKP